MVKIVRKSRGSISKIKCFIGLKSIFGHYCIQNVKDGIQIRVYTINKGSVAHFSQFVSVKVMKHLRTFREKLRKLWLRQMMVFLKKKRVCVHGFYVLANPNDYQI